MTLDEKIAKSINARMGEVLDLFQSTEHDVGESARVLAMLKGMLPLIEDIKTEVNQILNRGYQGQEPQDDEEEQPVEPDPQLEREIIEKQKEISKEVEKLRQLTYDQKKDPSQRRLLPDNLPMRMLDDTPWGYITFTAVNLANLVKELADNVGDYAAKQNNNANQSRGWSEYFKKSVEDWFDLQKQNMEDIYDMLKDQADLNAERALEQLRNLLNLDNLIKDNTDDIKQDTSDLKSDAADIKQDTQDIKGQNDSMAQNMSDCCHNMDQKIDRNNDAISGVGDKVDRANGYILDVSDKADDLQDTSDHIETMVEQLQPTTIANQSLAILSKENAILAEVQALRGLL